MIKEKLPWGRK